MCATPCRCMRRRRWSACPCGWCTGYGSRAGCAPTPRSARARCDGCTCTPCWPGPRWCRGFGQRSAAPDVRSSGRHLDSWRASVDAFVRPLPFTLIAAGVWFAHWRIAATDRALVARARRLGHVATLVRVRRGPGRTAAAARRAPRASSRRCGGSCRGTGGPAGPALAQPAADALVGLGLWLVHWVGLPIRLSEADNPRTKRPSCAACICSWDWPSR